MRVSIIIIAFLVISAFARNAEACSCIAPDPSRALGPDEVLFDATVEAIEVVQPPPPPDYKPSPDGIYVGGRKYVVKLVQLKALHGAPQSTVTTSASSCGYNFRVGLRYRIHAGSNKEGQLGVSVCSLTSPVGFISMLRYLLGL